MKGKLWEWSMLNQHFLSRHSLISPSDFIQNESDAEAYWLQTIILPSTKRILKQGGLYGPLISEIAAPDANWDKMGDSRFTNRILDQTLDSFGKNIPEPWGYQLINNGISRDLVPLPSWMGQQDWCNSTSIFHTIDTNQKPLHLFLYQLFTACTAKTEVTRNGMPIAAILRVLHSFSAADECMRAWQLTIGATRKTLMRLVRGLPVFSVKVI